MPVILGNKESTDSWLNDSSLSNLDKILKPYEETDLVRTQNSLFFVNNDLKEIGLLGQVWYPVTPAIGKISFDGPDCIKEVTSWIYIKIAFISCF